MDVTESAAKIGFKQFQYCSICQLNHRNGYRHIYSKIHKKNISSTLEKMMHKVAMAKEKVQVREISIVSQPELRKVWCYFCEKEVKIDYLQDGLIVSHHGLCVHFAEEDHRKAVVTFLMVNRLSKTENGTKFWIEESEVKRLSNIMNGQVAIYKQKKEEMHREEFTRICRTEVLSEYLLQQSCERRTVHNANVLDGNGQTGDADGDDEIGPNLNTYQQYLKSKRSAIAPVSIGPSPEMNSAVKRSAPSVSTMKQPMPYKRKR